MRYWVGIWVVLLSSTCLAFLPKNVPARTHTSTPDSARSAKPVFPDEFSELDEYEEPPAKLDPAVARRMEQARQRYLQALTHIENQDTTKAAEDFEGAIAVLNELASYPDLESNSDFTDLVQSVIEDYETYVRSIDNLNQNSSIFILRERLFEAVDARQGSIEPIPVPKTITPPLDLPATTIPLTYNEHVDANISFMAQGRGRRFMKTWIERTGKWFGLLRRIAKEEKMPDEIVHLAMMESALNPNAFSRAKAVGMWQFMKATGEEYSLSAGYWMDERRDPEKATRAAMRFLRDLYNDLGDWHLALAAYNCGAGGVRRAIRKSGIEKPNFWQIREHLPKETRDYVPLYIATTIITMKRDKFGFGDDSVDLHSPYSYESVKIDEPVNLSTLAKCAMVSVDSLRQLNPELVRDCTPPSGGYMLKVYSGTASAFQKSYAALNADEKKVFVKHTVERGETLSSIASAYGATAGELAEINGLSGYQARIKGGMTLNVPVRSGQATTTTTTSTASIEPEQKKSTPATPAASNGTTKTEQADAPTGATGRKEKVAAVHVVSKGDNLFAIATKYNIRLIDLRNWNNIPYDNDAVRIGDTLIVGTPSGVRKDQQDDIERLPVVQTKKHKVKRGETLASIARMYGTTTKRLAKINNLRGSNPKLSSGQRIKVEVKASSATSGQRQQASKANPKSYKVRKGDTLAKIAGKFRTTVAALKRRNPSLKSDKTLRAGQVVKLN
ncbi:MAG: LysM peptidoglycan-binding domain-containing protein [Ignavibacteria bacterium]|nr:LysM peptidoglycan-binding domain-containing protein [Ignavibacteria bacterium]